MKVDQLSWTYKKKDKLEFRNLSCFECPPHFCKHFTMSERKMKVKKKKLQTFKTGNCKKEKMQKGDWVSVSYDGKTLPRNYHKYH
ncbi:hypothetical protein JTE90_027109 [Oedothorax gibbosus]|uniref:Uncharacterized protein n=1 Tax=Oedothorax gibbosus TaxID=931172 RepID=A0AAV6TRF7_9ARAC|nr:hypothetical protein JTE90_027109 [Oedothorax gibbosus]